MKQLVTLVLLLLVSTAHGQHSRKSVVYFDHAKASLSLNDQRILSTLLAKVEAQKSDSERLGAENIDEIIISGYTDTDGSISYNQKLSQARAASVYSYFTSIFNDTTKLSTFYYGETKPVAPNGTEFDKRLNRRVEVVIRYATSQAGSTTFRGRPLALRVSRGNGWAARQPSRYATHLNKARNSPPAYLCP